MGDVPGPSTVPDVVDALAALWDTIAGCSVFDGPGPKPGDSKVDAIQIAVGNPSVVNDPKPAPGLALLSNEHYFVNCTLYSWGGGKAYKPFRDRCKVLLSQCRALVDVDNTLGGVAKRVVVGQGRAWVQSWTGSGRAVQVNFQVEVFAVV